MAKSIANLLPAIIHQAHSFAGKLGVDQIDLLLLHQALPGRFDLTREAYRALETLLADGRVRAIGVSNFMPEHLDASLSTFAFSRGVRLREVPGLFLTGVGCGSCSPAGAAVVQVTG